MPMTLVDSGETVTLRALFLDANDVVADPTGGTLIITLPDGTTVTRQITTQTTHDGTGRWHYDYTTAQDGIHTYVWTPTGPSTTAIQAGEFLVGDFTAPGPCTEWAGVEDVFSCGPCAGLSAPNYGTAAKMLDAATRILYELSGRRYTGICQHTVRPCRRSDRWESGRAWHGWHSGWGWCGCGASTPRECGCPAGPMVELPDVPVLQIDSVRVDGSLVPTSAYRLDEQRYLRRLDNDTWPNCQDLTADPATDDGTFQVTYWAGVMPPPDGVLAVQRLACELYQGCVGGDCVLPERIQNLTRLGMDVAFLDPNSILAEAGRTGIREVDLFLDAERYGRTHGSLLTVSPDRPGPSHLRVL